VIFSTSIQLDGLQCLVSYKTSIEDSGFLKTSHMPLENYCLIVYNEEVNFIGLMAKCICKL